MSSHHIVRDQQEPALVIHRYEDFSFDQLGTLLEWSPTVICCGPALEAVLQLGIKIDVAILAFESKQQYQELLAKQAPIKILTLSQPDYLSSALQMLHKDGHHAANVITTEVLAPEVLDLCVSFAGHLHLAIWDQTNRQVIVNQSPFKKWYPKGQQIECFSLSNDASIEVTFPEGQSMNASEGPFKVNSEGFVVMNAKETPFVIIESYKTS